MYEVKFDAIYQPTGEHFTPTSIDFEQNIVTGSFDGEDSDWCYFSFDGEFGDVILREFVGLQDCKERDFYNGDIVEIVGSYTIPSTNLMAHFKTSYQTGERFVIVKINNFFELRHVVDYVKTTNKTFSPSGCYDKPPVDAYMFWNLRESLKIVGNIYENANLLK